MIKYIFLFNYISDFFYFENFVKVRCNFKFDYFKKQSLYYNFLIVNFSKRICVEFFQEVTKNFFNNNRPGEMRVSFCFQVKRASFARRSIEGLLRAGVSRRIRPPFGRAVASALSGFAWSLRAKRSTLSPLAAFSRYKDLHCSLLSLFLYFSFTSFNDLFTLFRVVKIRDFIFC